VQDFLVSCIVEYTDRKLFIYNKKFKTRHIIHASSLECGFVNKISFSFYFKHKCYSFLCVCACVYIDL